MSVCFCVILPWTKILRFFQFFRSCPSTVVHSGHTWAGPSTTMTSVTGDTHHTTQMVVNVFKRQNTAPHTSWEVYKRVPVNCKEPTNTFQWYNLERTLKTIYLSFCSLEIVEHVFSLRFGSCQREPCKVFILLISKRVRGFFTTPDLCSGLGFSQRVGEIIEFHVSISSHICWIHNAFQSILILFYSKC